MWLPTAETAQWEAPPGLAPWRPLTDAEHAALESIHGDLSRWYARETAPARDTRTKKKAAMTAGGDA